MGLRFVEGQSSEELNVSQICSGQWNHTELQEQPWWVGGTDVWSCAGFCLILVSSLSVTSSMRCSPSLTSQERLSSSKASDSVCTGESLGVGSRLWSSACVSLCLFFSIKAGSLQPDNSCCSLKRSSHWSEEQEPLEEGVASLNGLSVGNIVLWWLCRNVMSIYGSGSPFQ